MNAATRAASTSAAKEPLEAGDRFGFADAVIRVGKRRVEDVGGERPEVLLIGRHFAGQRHSHEGATVKRAGKGDDAGASGKGARDLDRVLDRLGARRDEHRAILLARVDKRVQPFRQRDIALIRSDMETRVRERFRLFQDRRHHLRMPVAGVGHRDPGGEIDVATALDIEDERILGPRRVDALCRDASGDGGGLPLLAVRNWSSWRPSFDGRFRITRLASPQDADVFVARRAFSLDGVARLAGRSGFRPPCERGRPHTSRPASHRRNVSSSANPRPESAREIVQLSTTFGLPCSMSTIRYRPRFWW